MKDTFNLYTDLAWLWPLWGDATEYADYCQHAAELIRRHSARPVTTLLDVVFIENLYDPDPADEQYDMTILYLIRDHGRLRIETDNWKMGIFSLDTWRSVLSEIGFDLHESQYHLDGIDYTMFACVKTG